MSTKPLLHRPLHNRKIILQRIKTMRLSSKLSVSKTVFSMSVLRPGMQRSAVRRPKRSVPNSRNASKRWKLNRKPNKTLSVLELHGHESKKNVHGKRKNWKRSRSVELVLRRSRRFKGLKLDPPIHRLSLGLS
jgi:hypothetical protein